MHQARAGGRAQLPCEHQRIIKNEVCISALDSKTTFTMSEKGTSDVPVVVGRVVEPVQGSAVAVSAEPAGRTCRGCRMQFTPQPGVFLTCWQKNILVSNCSP
jgi:hypothetical protein